MPVVAIGQPSPPILHIIGDQRRPDVAYDAYHQVYLTVGVKPESRQDVPTIMGRFLYSNGYPRAIAFGISTRTDGTGALIPPRVAYSSERHAFLVVYGDRREGSPTQGQVVGRVVTFDEGDYASFLTGEIPLSPPGTVARRLSVAYGSYSGVYLVCWSTASATTECRRVSNDGWPIGGVVPVASGLTDVEPGLAYDPYRDEFAVAVVKNTTGNNAVLFATVRAGDGSIATSAVPLASERTPNTPRMQFDLRRRRYFVAWNSFYVPGIEGAFVLADGTRAPGTRQFLAVPFTSNVDQDSWDMARSEEGDVYFLSVGSGQVGSASTPGPPGAVILAAYRGSAPDSPPTIIPRPCNPCGPGLVSFLSPRLSGGGPGSIGGVLVETQEFFEGQLLTATAVTRVVTPEAPPDADVYLEVQQPSPHVVVTNPFHVAGYAVDTRATAGTGIDSVHVYAVPQNIQLPVMYLGAIAADKPTPALTSRFGDSRFGAAGFSADLTHLMPGAYTLIFYPHSAYTGEFEYTKVAALQI